MRMETNPKRDVDVTAIMDLMKSKMKFNSAREVGSITSLKMRINMILLSLAGHA